MPSLLTQFLFFLVLVQFILNALSSPPPFHDNLSTTSTSRIAVYEDINSDFQLVYAVSSACPQEVAFGDPTIDERQVAVLPLSAINEDNTLCTGPSPINIVGEQNIRREDDLLEKLQLGGMREALDNNPNAKQLIGTDGPATLLVGWHDGQRSCGVNEYPRDTIYFIINENNGKTISLKKPTQRDVVAIPPLMRALLIVAPGSKICLLVDTSSNANDDVTVTVVPDDGSPPTTTAATPGGSSPQAPTSAAPSTTPPVTSTAAPAVPSQAASQPGPVQTSPVSSPVSTVAPGSAAPSPVVSPDGSASGVSTPTASPVAPVSAIPVATPITSLAPSADPAGVGAALPGETPGIVEVVPTPEDNIILEDTSPPDTDEGSACFPASATVTLENGGVKAMDELEVGDRVLTDTGFSDVILFTHREGKSQNTFIRITVADGASLVVSPGHYVYSNKRKLKAALNLRAGDILNKSNGEQVVIIGIDLVSGVGLFNPQTISGSIVVNGLLASTYTTAVDPSIAHSVLMAPVRWMYRFSPRMVRVVSWVFRDGSPLLASLLPKGASVIGWCC